MPHPMTVSRSVLSLAIVMLCTAAAPASAAPPTCATPPVKDVRPGSLAATAPNCGALSGASYTITDTPDHGTVRIASTTGPFVRYVPDAGYTGTDAVTFTVTTNGGTSAPVTQQYAVSAAANGAPSCGAGSVTPALRAGGNATVSLFCTDPDGDPVSVQVPGQPAKAAASVQPGTTTVALAAQAGPGGADSFTYTASDGRVTTSAQTVNFSIAPAGTNGAPTCSPAAPVTVPRDRPAMLSISCSDPDNDIASVEIVTPPQHGTAAVGDPPTSPFFFGHRVTYVPAEGYTGTDSVQVRVRDPLGAPSTPVTITITVSEIPSAAPPLSVGCGAPTTLKLRPDRTAHVFSVCGGTAPAGPEIITPPAHGTLKVVPQGFEYRPAAGFTGADSFTYRILSAGGAGPSVTQPLDVSAAGNTDPNCDIWLTGKAPMPPADLVVRTGERAAVDIWCTDPEGDPVTVTLKDPDHGQLTGLEAVPASRGDSAYRATYEPDTGFLGFDTLEFTASDGRGGQASRARDVLVRPETFNTTPYCNTAPSSELLLVTGGEALHRERCSDGEGDPVRFERSGGPDDGQVAFSPFLPLGFSEYGASVRATAGFVGVRTFTLLVRDDRGGATGWYTRPLRVIRDPGVFDRELSRGEAGGALADDLPTSTKPVQLRLTTLNAGRARIVTKGGSAPAGFAPLGLTFDVTAPAAIAEAPLDLRFRFDEQTVTSAIGLTGFTVFFNGDPVGPCEGEGAIPNPCVASRERLSTGDAEVVVRSIRGGTWAFGTGGGLPSSPPQAPGAGEQAPQPTDTRQPPVTGEGPNPETTIGAPTLALGRLPGLKVALAKGVRLRVTGQRAGRLKATLGLDGRSAARLGLSRGKAVVVATGTAAGRPGKPVTLTARFTKRARKALGRARSVRLSLRVAVGDGPPTTRTITLKR